MSILEDQIAKFIGSVNEIPVKEIAHQIVMATMIDSIVSLIVCVLITIACGVIWNKASHYSAKVAGTDDMGPLILYAISGILGFTCVIGVACMTISILQCVFSPYSVVIESLKTKNGQ